MSEFEHWLNTRRDLPVAEVFHEVVAKFDDLRAALEKHKADTEMLNWLESSTEGHGFCHTGYGDYRYYAHQVEGYRTVREVLTAAMKGQ